jgi:hypothetical protein
MLSTNKFLGHAGRAAIATRPACPKNLPEKPLTFSNSNGTLPLRFIVLNSLFVANMLTQIVDKGGEFYEQPELRANTTRNSPQQRCASIANTRALFSDFPPFCSGKKDANQRSPKQIKRVDARIFSDPRIPILPPISSYCSGFYLVKAVQLHQ